MKLLYKILIIATAAIIFSSFVYAYFDLKKDFEIQYENTNQLINETRQNKELFLTRGQMEGYIANSQNKLLKQLADSLKIKTKHIVRTISNNYYHQYKDTIIEAEEKDSVYSAIYAPDKCLKVEVSFSEITKQFLFQNPITDYKSESILFESRENKKGKKRRWPFGKKITKSETLNNCNGETTTKEVTVIKR